jgi:hypothetical protein
MPFHCHPGHILVKDKYHRLISHQHCNSVNLIIFVGSCTGSSLFHLMIWQLGIINQYVSFHFVWTVLIMLWCIKWAPFFWVTQTHVYSCKLISYLDWPIWCEHQVYCHIPGLTHTTSTFINQSVSLCLHVHKQWSVPIFFLFFCCFSLTYTWHSVSNFRVLHWKKYLISHLPVFSITSWQNTTWNIVCRDKE